MLELTLRSTVILATAWALTRMLPRATAATRHLVWHGALLASLSLPLAALLPLPRFELLPATSVTRLSASVEQMRDAVDRTYGSGASVSSGGTGTSRASAASIPSGSSDVSTSVGTAGTSAILLWFLTGWFIAARIARRAGSVPIAWHLELAALRQRLRIERDVRIGLLPHEGSPIATDLLRASVLLPPSALHWTDERRRAVLLHELAHIKRRDCRIQLIAHAACAMFWFNPLVWIAAAELRRERERACDDFVLHMGTRPSSYARHLLDIARELPRTLRPSAALSMARRSDLEGRLLAVLAPDRARAPRRATRWLVIMMLMLTSVAALGVTETSPMLHSPGTPEGGQTLSYVVGEDVMYSSEVPPPPLTEAKAALQDAGDPQTRERATLRLALSSGRDVVPALLQALADSDSQVREKAIIGLALRRDPRTVEPLIAALGDGDSQVREKAAIALGTSGDSRATDALTRALDDPDPQVRKKAAAGLMLAGLIP